LVCGLTVGTAAKQHHEQGTRSMDSVPGNTVVTVVGCLKEDPRNPARLVLAKPMQGTAISVPNGNCDDAVDIEAFEIHDPGEGGFKKVNAVGQIIELTGKLGEVESGDKLRKLHADHFRVVPVVPPPPPIARVEPRPAPPIIEPSPAPEYTPTPEPTPVPTTGVMEEKKPLPHSASPLASIALLGLLSFAGAFALRLFDRSRVSGRL